MIRACLSLLAGIFVLQLSSFAVHSDLSGIAIVAFICAIFLRRPRALRWFCLGAALFALGADERIAERLAPRFAGDSMVMQVRVVDFPSYRRDTSTFVAETLHDPRFRGRVRLGWFQPPVAVRLGDVWQFELRLRRPRGNRNAGVFDYEAWLFRSGIGATGYVVAGRRNHLLQSGRLGVIDGVRQGFVDRLDRAFPDDPAGAVLAAISVGARHRMTPEQWERYALTGTSHLMAISGLHVGLAAAGAYSIAAAMGVVLGFRGNQHMRATAIALVAAGLYAAVSGFAVPAQRATLMIGLVALAVVRMRRPRPASIIALAGFVMAAAQPVNTMAPGFKLSFAAVIVLAWIARQHRVPTSRGSLMRRAADAVMPLARLQVMLLLGLLPLTVLIFNRVALVAPPVNLVAVPVFSIVTVPLSLAGLLLGGPLAVVGDKALWLAAHSIAGIELFIAWAATLDIVGNDLPELSGWAWTLLAFLPAWIVLPPGWPGRSLAWLALVALLTYTSPRAPPGCVDVEVLDVGQGLAVVATTATQALLYDTGAAFRSGGSVADTVIVPRLKRRGVERIDHLVISHGDLDHAGGTDAILAAFDVGRIMSSEPLGRAHARQAYCRAGAAWETDRVRFRFVHPDAGSSFDGNDASCVLLVEAGRHRIVLPGDIERPAERTLVQRGAVERADVVVIPHHGSRTSSSLPFVRALSPDVAIVSAGYDNRWGFPKSDIVERWASAGATVLNTGDDGAIEFRMCRDSGVGRVVRQRFESRRFWHE